MTKDEALRLALEALKQIDEAMPFPVAKLAQKVIKEALAQPEQEPVAWISPKELLVMRGNAYAGSKDWRVNLGLEPEEGDVGLYTTPSQRTWVGLTEEEWLSLGCKSVEEVRIGLAIQAKLKEKNT
jgi:hypothetical protein